MASAYYIRIGMDSVMLDGIPAKIQWHPLPNGAPVMALTQMGDDIMLTSMFGVIRYSLARDSEELATYLERLAATVREAAVDDDAPIEYQPTERASGILNGRSPCDEGLHMTIDAKSGRCLACDESVYDRG